MPRSPIEVPFPPSESYSEIIDVRSESEFAQDCIPGAINLPVLHDRERAEVGTTYHQRSPFEARKQGAAVVARNVAAHLEAHFACRDRDYTPLIYCWRGGQRSSSLAQVLAQIGWRTLVLQGGYKAYRAYVRQQLAARLPQFRYRILCGLTGTGKTQLLHQLQSRGVQVLDLEGLAHHRGSLLGQVWGDRPQAQPAQKAFESQLLQAVQALDPRYPVWVESESSKVGNIHLPAPLWQAMKQASCVEIALPVAERVEWLLQQYPHWRDNPQALKHKLSSLKAQHGRQRVARWHHLVDTGQLRTLVRELLECHYDPAYRRSMERTFAGRVELSLPLPDRSAGSIARALDALVARSQPQVLEQARACHAGEDGRDSN